MKKFLAAAALLLAACTSWSSDFTLKCEIAKTVFAPGEKIAFDMTATYPEVYKPYLWRAYLNARKVPADFCEKTGAYNNNHKTYPEIFILKGDGKQPQKGYFRCPAVKASGEKVSTFFSSENWPVGDYVVTIQVLLVHKNPKARKAGEKEYCYKQSYIKFTVKAPDAAASGK